MTKIECLREEEVLELLQAGRWPDDCGDELRTHISSCAVCADLADVASAFVSDREELLRDVELPGSGLVWWRMQLRARNEAAREARKTVVTVQALAVAVAVIVAFAVLNWMTPGWMHSVRDAMLVDLTALAAGPLILIALVAWLALTPVAVWLLFARSARR